MPRTRSAKKNMRKTRKRTLRKRLRKERLKKVVRGFQEALEERDATKITETLRKVQRALAKAGTKGLIHRNAVNRRKARLARAANKAKASVPA